MNMIKFKIRFFFKKIISLIIEKRLPWFLEERIEFILNYIIFYKKKIINNVFINKKLKAKIIFICGYHGRSGGVISIANTASLLAVEYNVSFLSFPGSYYNNLIDTNIKIINSLDFSADIYICDASFNHDILRKLLSLNKIIIALIHGFPNSLHQMSVEYLKETIALASKVIFVSDYQANSFGLEKNKYLVIPNYTKRIIKNKFNNNIGSVGNLDRIEKGAMKTIEIGLKSNADFIYLWGKSGMPLINQRVKIFPWNKNKRKIYNSFDVLVFMSQEETFGMVVIEAISAGVPCLLYSIKVFEQFRNCPGVILIESNEIENAYNIVNYLLSNKSKFHDQLIEFWNINFSEHAVRYKWNAFIEEILK